jgi:hypothetical protein
MSHMWPASCLRERHFLPTACVKSEAAALLLPERQRQTISTDLRRESWTNRHHSSDAFPLLIRDRCRWTPPPTPQRRRDAALSEIRGRATASPRSGWRTGERRRTRPRSTLRRVVRPWSSRAVQGPAFGPWLGSSRRLVPTLCVTRSSPPVSTPVSHSATCKKPPFTPTRAPRCATTGHVLHSTDTSPASSPPSSPAPPRSPEYLQIRATLLCAMRRIMRTPNSAPSVEASRHILASESWRGSPGNVDVGPAV